MPSLTISKADMFDAFVEHLEHLTECRDFIEAFKRGKHDEYVIKVATEEAKRKKYDYDLTRYTSAMKEYDDSYKEQGFADEIAMPERCTLDRLMEDIGRFRSAKKVIEAIAGVVGHYDRNLPRDISGALDALTHFDDSE